MLYPPALIKQSNMKQYPCTRNHHFGSHRSGQPHLMQYGSCRHPNPDPGSLFISLMQQDRAIKERIAQMLCTWNDLFRIRILISVSLRIRSRKNDKLSEYPNRILRQKGRIFPNPDLTRLIPDPIGSGSTRQILIHTCRWCLLAGAWGSWRAGECGLRCGSAGCNQLEIIITRLFALVDDQVLEKIQVYQG